MLMAKYIIRSNTDLPNIRVCKNNCVCCIDPVKTLVEGYKSYVWNKFEACLQAKWSIGDCVVGCHNESYNETDSTRRNAHQRRVSKILIANLVKALKEADDFPENPKDFETIYDWVAKYVESVRVNIQTDELDEADDSQEDECMETSEELSIHICPLLKYDTALRMSYNMASPEGGLITPKENCCLPNNYVYLQRGALEGARGLHKICMLSEIETELTPKRRRFTLKKYIDIKSEEELEGPTKIEISRFNSDLRSLGSYHLENFLCVYHQLFRDWAKGYEIRVNELKKQKNN